MNNIDYRNNTLLQEKYNPLPGIITYDTTQNPTIHSPSSTYDIPFYMTKETLMDIDICRNFVKNCIFRFRRSRYYKAYKGYLLNLGLDRSQIFGNIDITKANIEMHHAILTIFDIALLITEHMINTVGRVCTYDIVQILIEEHFNNNIPIVMLDETSHELYHADIENYLPPDMVFGKWWILIYKYKYGITMEIAKKILIYIARYYNNNTPMKVSLREDILSFAKYNEYGCEYNSSMAIPSNNIDRKENY